MYAQASGSCWDVLSQGPFSGEKSSSTALRCFKTGLTFCIAGCELGHRGRCGFQWGFKSEQHGAVIRGSAAVSPILSSLWQSRYSTQGSRSEMAHLLIWDINSAHSPPQGELNELSLYSKQQEKKACIEISICTSWHGFIEFNQV